jgi:hypothetical protein
MHKGVRHNLTKKCNVTINTISGGIVNFGGAIKIAPISITKTSGSGTTGSTSGTTAPIVTGLGGAAGALGGG